MTFLNFVKKIVKLTSVSLKFEPHIKSNCEFLQIGFLYRQTLLQEVYDDYQRNVTIIKRAFHGNKASILGLRPLLLAIMHHQKVTYFIKCTLPYHVGWRSKFSTSLLTFWDAIGREKQARHDKRKPIKRKTFSIWIISSRVDKNGHKEKTTMRPKLF